MTIKANYFPPKYAFIVLFIGVCTFFTKEDFWAIIIAVGIIILFKLFSRYIYIVGTIKIDDWGITYNKDEYSVSWDDIKDMKLKRYGYWMSAHNYHIAYKLIIKKKNNEIKEIEDIEYFLYIPHLIKYIIKWYSKIDYFK